MRSGSVWPVTCGCSVAEFVAAFENRILNIHPSLLPSFPGLDVQQAALDHGVRVSGCTVHFVDAGLDSGPIVGQRSVPVRSGDDATSLAARILRRNTSSTPKRFAVCSSRSGGSRGGESSSVRSMRQPGKPSRARQPGT